MKRIHPARTPGRREGRGGKGPSLARDCAISVGLYLACVLMCMTLRRFDPNSDSSYVAMIFLLDVFLTALLTEGYLFGILMAVVGVLRGALLPMTVCIGNSLHKENIYIIGCLQ